MHEVSDWIKLAEGGVDYQDLVNMVVDLLVPQEAGKFQIR